MRENQISTGKIIDGKEVFAVELTNTRGSKVKIYNYGAIVSSFIVKNAHGEDQDIVLGFDDIDGYLNEDYLSEYPYLGAVIGRYANRIKDGKFQIGGSEYQLTQSLHGGENGFDKKVWDILPTIDPSLTLQYISPAGEENFPGNLTVQLSFKLTDEDELILDYHAVSDAATAINLTHHTYFNLARQGGNVAEHHHRMTASKYLEQDNDYIVTGKVLPGEGTIHDFLGGKAIGQDWDPEEGYDQTYVLDKPYGQMGLASETTERTSGLKLEVYTTEPVAHFYTAKYLNVAHGKGGRDYKKFEAFCIETQHAPNSVNIPAFPKTVLAPGETYLQTTIFKVTV
ncbi:aldose 1-epimerase [Pedobacter westerhofensis]|uniref:Aldose 1-epimerase n=1 Tax=Pedobacter westerhofensis TaxID=425512 RepID=A0A521FJZ1_9SPHI|nr:aldose epimerase family protein [Pedobacter westerhofensis]SMO95920.1 aldose 1-epimerase [Pedobacter westerhofensis]